MKIEILYFDGCPTYGAAEKTVGGVLAEQGIEVRVELVAVNTDEEAQRLRFPGSPTIRMDGLYRGLRVEGPYLSVSGSYTAQPVRLLSACWRAGLGIGPRGRERLPADPADLLAGLRTRLVAGAVEERPPAALAAKHVLSVAVGHLARKDHLTSARLARMTRDVQDKVGVASRRHVRQRAPLAHRDVPRRFPRDVQRLAIA
jgi:hypothetical protein